ncbi:MAG TPA: diaminopimelate decarboxylase [Clostridiales bacterium]|nr:diaminopimelate decarboxylase [Clostridiales bacterium]
MDQYYTIKTSFFGNTNPQQLIEQYGSPLYVYNESILRQRCRDMADFIPYANYIANYSTKANSNLELLKIIREEGLHVDAMSPGEIYVLLAAGFRPDQIFYIGNNVSIEEMMYAVNLGITVSVDSLSQLETFGQHNPGGNVAVRINPGFGIGHHEKVVTGGEKTKFGINDDRIDDVKALIQKYNLNLVGINQHIGSLFMEGEPYLQSIRTLLDIASLFEGLDFIDMGGGFGIPYQKQDGEKPLELKLFGEQAAELLDAWASRYNPDIQFMSEPGRYVVAECGVLLGTAHARKENGGIHYVGTDLGFNVLARPVMYDAWHDIEVYPKHKRAVDSLKETVTIVGNICESGDIIAYNRQLPVISIGDILGVMDAGAYGHTMASNYNNRLRPAEVLIRRDGTDKLIRRRDTMEDLIRVFPTHTV